MSSSSEQPNGPAGPIQLSGWKEIAAYLSRSVRTVQRWEKDFGLPVRRFGMSKPESVFAFAREIDAWLETTQGINARTGAGAAESARGGGGTANAVDSAGHRSRESRFPRRWVIRIASAAVICTALITALLFLSGNRFPGRRTDLTSPAATPADWRIDLDSLVVSDANGNVLWKRAFARELIPPDPGNLSTPPRGAIGGITDFEGDGTREVWFVARPQGASAESAVYLFEHDGRLRWTYKPDIKVRFGEDTFGPSWFVDRAFVTPNPSGGPGRALWMSMVDLALFPSAIQRLDPKTGMPLSAYWTNGSIVTAALDASTSPPKLYVGACYNETRAGSLSVLDALNPNGSAPAALDKYRCMDCPPGEPLAFLVFPKPSRFAGSDATGPVETITPQSDGSVGVRVRHAVSAPDASAVGIFQLDASLTPISVDTADGYLSVYNALVERGDAPAGAPRAIDPEREFLSILWWNAAAQRFMEMSKRR